MNVTSQTPLVHIWYCPVCDAQVTAANTYRGVGHSEERDIIADINEAMDNMSKFTGGYPDFWHCGICDETFSIKATGKPILDHYYTVHADIYGNPSPDA